MNPLTLPIIVLLATSIVSLLGLVFCLCHVVREIAQRREVAKAASQRLADWYQRIQDGPTTKDGQDVPGLQNALALPSAEKVLTYERPGCRDCVDHANAVGRGCQRQFGVPSEFWPNSKYGRNLVSYIVYHLN